MRRLNAISGHFFLLLLLCALWLFRRNVKVQPHSILIPSPTTFLSEFSAVYLPLLHLLMDQSWAPPWKNPFAFWVENGKNSRNGDLSPFILPHREKQFKNICVTLWNCFTRWRKRALFKPFFKVRYLSISSLYTKRKINGLIKVIEKLKIWLIQFVIYFE